MNTRNGRGFATTEVGCGYGTFSRTVARRIRGILQRLACAGVANVLLYQRDVIADCFPLPPGRVDAVLLFNILHAENPVELLRISAGVPRPGGRVSVIHWRSDVKTPRGPDLSVRPRPADVVNWARHTGLLAAKGTHRILPPWHFGLTLQRIGDLHVAWVFTAIGFCGI